MDNTRRMVMVRPSKRKAEDKERETSTRAGQWTKGEEREM